IVAPARADSVCAQQVELEQRLGHAEVVPRVDVQRGHIELLIALEVAELIPPGIVEFPRDYFVPIARGPTGACHHAEQWERVPKRPEGGCEERHAWRAAYFIAVVCKPTEATSQFDITSLANAKIVVTISRCADRTARRLRNHGFQIRMPGLRLQNLHIAFIRASNRPDVSIRP